MTADNRQPKGIPAGGQFAASAHGEPEVLLTPARRPALAGWPEALPEPAVDFRVTEEGSIITEAKSPAGDFIEVWDRNDGSGNYDSHALGAWDGADDDTIEQATQWLAGHHNVVVQEVRAEEEAAVARARARILSKVTGIATPATDEELAATIESNGTAAQQALKDVELASAGLAARKILAAHPEAAYAEIQTDSWENGEFVAGAVVKDTGYKPLHRYFEDDVQEGEDGYEANKDIVGLLKNLDAQPQNSHWAGAFSTGSYGEDLYTIDLQRAAAWTPAEAAPLAPIPSEPAPAQNVAQERPCSDGPWCTAPRGKHIDGCNMESF